MAQVSSDNIDRLKEEFKQVTDDLSRIRIEHEVLSTSVQKAKAKIESEREQINTYLDRLGFKFDPAITFEENLVNARSYLESVLANSVGQYKTAIAELQASLTEARTLESSLRG